MEALYYLPIEEKEGLFMQSIPFDKDELEHYSYGNFSQIIEKHFTKIRAVVVLRTGRFEANVFRQNGQQAGLSYCLVNENNHPSQENEIELNVDEKNIIQKKFIEFARKSEGIFPDQIIDVLSDFVTPKIQFFDKSYYYHHSIFSNRSVLILGTAGSGKTTLLRRLLIDKLTNNLEAKGKLFNLPIYVQLRGYNTFDYDFKTYLSNHIVNSVSSFSLKFKQNIIGSGKLTLLLDGADELDFEKFRFFSEEISHYQEENPLVTLIITSRPDRMYKNIVGFDICNVLPFDFNQINELNSRKLGIGITEEFTAALNAMPEIYEIVKNPLLLTISHFLFKHKNILPINSAQLIKEFVAALVSNWDSQRNIDRKYQNTRISPIEVVNFLGKIAFILSEMKVMTFTVTSIGKYFRNFEEDAELSNFLEFVEFSTGLIYEFGRGEWQFTHKSLQDFLCSNYLVESVGTIKENVFNDKDWASILTMIAGLSSDPELLLKKIDDESTIPVQDKLYSSLNFFVESILLDKVDLQHSFEQLEEFFLTFEELNNIEVTDVSVAENRIELMLKLNKESERSFIVRLLRVIYKLRFTKYEYDFWGYLKQSPSHILKSVAWLSLKQGDIKFIEDGDSMVILQSDIPSE